MGEKMANIDLVQLTEQTKKLTAMVVEDEAVANELLSSTFKNFFAEVKSAFNGKEAIEMYEKMMPDIIFLDIIMPEMDGIETLRNIRKADDSVIVVILTGYGCPDTIRDATDLNVSEYLSKPFGNSELLDIIDKALNIEI